VNPGLVLVLFAGVMNGSFATPLKRIRGWKWEHSWLLWSVTGLLFVPAIAALATVPDLAAVYRTAGPQPVAIAAIFGFCWGISAVLFGLGVDRVGLAVGFGTIIGVSSALGALVPFLTLHGGSLATRSGVLLSSGIVLLLAGVVCCSIAGRLRDGSRTKSSNMRSGVVICLLSGVGAPMINYALNFGSGITEAARQLGASETNALNAIWPIALGAAFVPNAFYCVLLMRRNGNAALFRVGAAGNVVLASCMGILWMGSNLLYGYGSQLMGPLGLTLGWPIMMGSVILTANGWGGVTGEWKGAPAAARVWIALGVLALLAGIQVIAAAGRTT
jgi:L-rhamnose-H+ transport protein